MIKRTVEISNGPVHLSISRGQMKLSYQKEEMHSIPVEDIGLLVLSHPAISYTHALLYQLLEHNVVILFCNASHLPEGMLLPFEHNQVYSERLQFQVDSKIPLKKRLWKQVVQAKIKAQSRLLIQKHGDDAGLNHMVSKVKSGDPSNVEAQAAKRYWKHLFPKEGFKRDPDQPFANSLLNYGYAVIRAAVARSLTAAGLHPSIGLHHHNKYNPYCLADDMMEPLRPIVDAAIYELYEEEDTLRIDVNKVTKKKLLLLLAEHVIIKEKSYPLMESLHLMSSGLVDCIAGEKDKLSFPELK